MPQIQLGDRDRAGMDGCYWYLCDRDLNREVETRCVRFVKQLETVCFMGN
jgi:hypothetical protein